MFFERHRGWSGICIEPGPEEFDKLNTNRKSTNVNACVSDYNGESEYTYIKGYSMMLSGLSENYNFSHQQRIHSEVTHYGGEVNKIMMPVRTLQSILDEAGVSDVDYCSIDTEGSELNIVRSIDFEKTNIKIFSIENNYGDTSIKEYLESKGYTHYAKIQWDDIFIKL